MKKIKSFLEGGVSYEPIRIGDGFGWMRFDAESGQTIVHNDQFEHGGKLYQIAFPAALGAEELILANGPGQTHTQMELYERVRAQVAAGLRHPDERVLDYITLYLIASWVFDRSEAINYLAFTGRPGSGKSQALHVASRLSYRALLCNGGDTTASLVRLIEMVEGTTVIDEAQQDLTDPTSRVHKLFASGNQKGRAMRTLVPNARGGWDFERHSVFCPKICGGQTLPGDAAIMERVVEIRMPAGRWENLGGFDFDRVREQWDREAGELRNHLLLARQRRLVGTDRAPYMLTVGDFADRDFDPRDKQVLSWVLNEAPDVETLHRVFDFLGELRRERREINSIGFEAEVLYTTYEMLRANDRENQHTYLANISKEFENRRAGRIDSRSIGKVLRDNGIGTHRATRGMIVDSTYENVRDAIIRRGYEAPEESALATLPARDDVDEENGADVGQPES